MTEPLRKHLRLLGGYFLAWTVVGLFFFGQGLIQRSATHDPTPWWHYLATWLTGVYLCAAFTPVIRWLADRFPIRRGRRIRAIALQFLFSLLFSISELAIHAVILRAFGLFPLVMTSYATTFIVLITIGFHQNVATYWTILAIHYGFRFYRKYQEREKQALLLEVSAAELRTRLVQAQMSALKMQLQPHFLFNTLNAIMVLVRQQKTADAEETLVRLSDLLRLVLEDVEAQEVPLRRELEFLRLYLGIEQVRFQDRLQIDISADPAVLDAAVPHMTLQPIVENAIRHGISRSSAAGSIEIRAARVNGTLEISIRDDGPGLAPEPSGRPPGIGLSNTRARLRQLYGESAQLTLQNGPRSGAIATVVLPYREMPSGSVSEVSEPHAVHHTAG